MLNLKIQDLCYSRDVLAEYFRLLYQCLLQESTREAAFDCIKEIYKSNLQSILNSLNSVKSSNRDEIWDEFFASIHVLRQNDAVYQFKDLGIETIQRREDKLDIVNLLKNLSRSQQEYFNFTLMNSKQKSISYKELPFASMFSNKFKYGSSFVIDINEMYYLL